MNDCIEWAKGRDRMGYGRTKRDGKEWKAHRLVFFDCNGWVPRVVRHVCDNPLCVNPAHLLGGTHKENTADMYARDRSNTVRGNGLPQAKLTPDLVHWIRASQLPLKVAANWCGVTESAISLVRSRKNWKHI